ncbi:class E sortase [Streptomyces sp. WMMC500]|uniref:class E sortase n=1 Tax=Streptomyces sp. WMMC500 TaxID=3015154 RepID=UPI00248C20F3|nr:class E sortase [Streptomyces sp. WMMC500]WBB57888.1 class E sortase [Streptomyces sp. WMMC500]
MAATDDERESGPAAQAAEEAAPEAPETAAQAPAHPRGRRGPLATAVSLFGEVLITVGVLMALFVVYSLYWTNVQANREAGRMTDDLRDSWENSPDDGKPRPVNIGDLKGGIGFLHVPAMEENILVREGTATDDLNRGVAGYYTEPVKSAMPWDRRGNFSLAAHRDGHGAKFHDIHRIEEGDPIVFETKDRWFVYKTYAVLSETSKYNTAVLDKIPEESGKSEPGRYITLTTCTPMYTSRHRYVVWGELERVDRVDEERTPPPELA